MGKEWTIDTWMKGPYATNNDGWHTLAKGTNANGGQHQIVWQDDGSAYVGGSTSKMLGVLVFDNVGNSFYNSGIGMLSLPVDSWVRLTVVATSNQYHFYLDGEKQGVVNVATIEKTDIYTIGCSYNENQQQTFGTWADFRFYNHSMTDLQIQNQQPKCEHQCARGQYQKQDSCLLCPPGRYGNTTGLHANMFYSKHTNGCAGRNEICNRYESPCTTAASRLEVSVIFFKCCFLEKVVFRN
jgi:hypothetical protein